MQIQLQLPKAFLALGLLSIAFAQTSTVVVPSAPQPTASQYTSDTDFQSSILAAHNFYRDQHNASALVWNDTSAKFAANWASKCVFEHSDNPTGENLASGYANASASVDVWGLERASYDFAKAQFSEATGHFTQVVWKATSSVGCGRSNCAGKSGGAPGWYVVCEYYPAGNVIGAFATNVQSQTKGAKTDTVETGVTAGAARRNVAWKDAVMVSFVAIVVAAWIV